MATTRNPHIKAERSQRRRGNRFTIAHRPAAPFDHAWWLSSKKLSDAEYWHNARYENKAPRMRPNTARVPCSMCGKETTIYLKAGRFAPHCRRCKRTVSDLVPDPAAIALAPTPAVSVAPKNAAPVVPPVVMPERSVVDESARQRQDEVLDAVAAGDDSNLAPVLPLVRTRYRRHTTGGGRRVGTRPRSHGILNGRPPKVPYPYVKLPKRSRVTAAVKAQVRRTRERIQAVRDLGLLEARHAPAQVLDTWRFVKVAGLPVARAAVQLDMSRKTAHKWLKKANEVLGLR